MHCGQFRQIIGAEPAHESAEVAAHRAECRECAEYARQMQHLDSLLKRALTVPVPEASAVVVPLRPAAQSKRSWYAMAAGVALAVAIGFTVWLSAPTPLAAADLIAHIDYEGAALRTTDERVAPERLVGVLNRAGVSLDPMAGDVSFASFCPIRGRRAPHLVVQTAAGPVTVIVLPKEHIETAQNFDEQGYTGVLLPSGPGSVAVIAKDEAVVQEAASRVMAAIRWNP